MDRAWCEQRRRSPRSLVAALVICSRLAESRRAPQLVERGPLLACALGHELQGEDMAEGGVVAALAELGQLDHELRFLLVGGRARAIRPGANAP